MKGYIKLFLATILSSTLLFGGAFIHSFVAESNGDNISISWQTTSESNVKNFEILRGYDKDHLSLIATVEAEGDNSYYTFVDENAYKTNNSFYAYGLVIVDKDGSRSEPMYVFTNHSVSGIKQTWGSIKALFR